MADPFTHPAIRYGLGIGSAATLTFIAFSFLDGILRWLVLGLGIIEIVVIPQVLKQVLEYADSA